MNAVRSPVPGATIQIAALALACLAVGCRPRLEVTHWPLNPDAAQPVTYTAAASDPNGVK
jgi:hypothetical protein